MRIRDLDPIGVTDRREASRRRQRGRRVRLRVDVLGGVLGLLVGWGVLGSPAISLIARLASSGADSLARFGDRAAPASLAFGLVLGLLLWSLVWVVAGLVCARAYTALRLRRPGRIRRAA